LIEINGGDNELVTTSSSDPYSLFLFAMNSPEARVKYIACLRRFFDYIKLEKEVILTSGVPEVNKQKKRTGARKEKWILFTERAKSDGGWAFFKIVAFLQFEKERVEQKEIDARLSTTLGKINSLPMLRFSDNLSH
jgi:hypothetical protein